jgi:ABC-2 type transport system ATP-binding protein
VGRGDRAEITAPEPMPVLYAISSWAMQRSLAIPDISVQRPTLEDIYLRLTADHA